MEFSFGWLYPPSRKSIVFALGLQTTFNGVGLAAPRSYDDHCFGAVENREREGDPRGRWLRAVVNRYDRLGFLMQGGVTREEGARVTVGSYTEQQKVERGVLVPRIQLAKLGNVVFRRFGYVQRRVDGVHVALRHRHVVEQFLLDVRVCAVLAGEGHVTFVAVEYVPPAPIDVLATAEALGDHGGYAPARQPHRKVPVIAHGPVRGSYDEVAYLSLQLVSAGINVQLQFLLLHESLYTLGVIRINIF